MSLVRIATTKHRVEVVAEHRDDVTVDGPAAVKTVGGTTTVDDIKDRITVRVPGHTNVVVGTTSGRVLIAGPVGDVAITTTSGRVEINDAASVDVRAESSRVEVNGVDNHCRIRTGNGKVLVDDCGGHADLATDKGRIELTAANGTVEAHCVSGRIVVTMDSANDVQAETVTGRIDVSLPPGIRPYDPISQGLQDITPDGYDCTIVARSVSGRVSVESR